MVAQAREVGQGVIRPHMSKHASNARMRAWLQLAAHWGVFVPEQGLGGRHVAVSARRGGEGVAHQSPIEKHRCMRDLVVALATCKAWQARCAVALRRAISSFRTPTYPPPLLNNAPRIPPPVRYVPHSDKQIR